MNEFDDPMAYQQLQQQQADLARQIATAARLRKEATPLGTGQGMPQGQMISGRYVAPAWSQMLAGTVNPMLQHSAANQAEQAASQEQSRLSRAVAQAREQAIQSMPQVTPGIAPTPDRVAPAEGPPTEAGRPPMAVGTIPGTPGTSAVLPNATARAKWLAQASGIPGFGETAAAMDKITGEEVTREDKQNEQQSLQAAKAWELHQNKMLELQKAQMEIEGRLATHTADNEMRRELEKSRDNLQWQLERARIEAGKYEKVASATQAGAERQAHYIDTAAERLSNKMTPVTDMLQAAHRVQATIDSYGPAVKSIPGMGHANVISPWLQGNEGAQNRAAVNNLASEIMSAKAGLSQTLSEAERVAATTLIDPKFTDAQFRANWPHIVNKINNHITSIAAGFPSESVDLYQQRGALMKPVVSKWAGKEGVPDAAYGKGENRVTVPGGTYKPVPQASVSQNPQGRALPQAVQMQGGPVPGLAIPPGQPPRPPMEQPPAGKTLALVVEADPNTMSPGAQKTLNDEILKLPSDTYYRIGQKVYRTK